MQVIGLVGGTGSGKGYCSQIFNQHGIPSLDTDLVSRIVTSKGDDCLNELVDYFGKEILEPNGELNRRALANIAFQSREKTLVLNKITHKHILNYCRNWLNEKKKEGCLLSIIDAPLLFESGFNKECDIIISVLCSNEKRIERVMKRDGIDKEDVKRRIALQHSEEFLINNSDYVIRNEDGLDIKGQIQNIINDIQK